MRHAGASLLGNLNVLIGSIQRILGHENRSTTEIYLHSMEGSERLAMEVFEMGTTKKVPPRVPPKKEGVTDLSQ